MSRNTVDRLLRLEEPPRYEPRAKGSLLDPFKKDIAETLSDDADVPATVILDHLQSRGYEGQITILKDYLQEERPRHLARRSFQRTSYVLGEIGQFDWWDVPIAIPVGKNRFRKPHRLVATLPHSAAHEAVFTFTKTMGDFCPAFVQALERFGGVPEAGVFDNDSSIVAKGSGKNAVLQDEVAALFGHVRLKPLILEKERPESKGQVERTVGYLETSFVPLRSFESIEDLQDQHDTWARDKAHPRHHRRVGARVTDANNVERGFLHQLPDPLPDTDFRFETKATKDLFIRVFNCRLPIPPDFQADGCRSGRRSPMSSSTSRDPRSPVTKGATSQPTSSFIPPTLAPCGCRATPSTAFPRTTSIRVNPLGVSSMPCMIALASGASLSPYSPKVVSVKSPPKTPS